MDEIIRIAKGGGATPGAPATPAYTEEEPEVFYLDWSADHDPRPIVIPNAYTDGKARIRLGCNNACTVRIDWPGADNRDIKLDYGQASQGAAIPKGIAFAVMRLRDVKDGDKRRVAVTFSR